MMLGDSGRHIASNILEHPLRDVRVDGIACDEDVVVIGAGDQNPLLRG